MSRWFAPAAVLFGLCLSTGVLASFVSVPPLWLNAVWPPAGLALAGFIVYGRRIWPAPFLGAWIACGFVAFERYASEPALQLIAGSALIGSLSVLQALFGLSLIRRLLPDSMSLHHPRDIALFLLIAGPAQAVIPALLGPLLPMVAGVWPWSEFTVIAFDWWRSELIGGLVFAPVALAVLSPRGSDWRGRLATVTLPLVLGIILYAVAYKAGPHYFTAASGESRLLIELGGGLVLALFTFVLMVVTGQAAAIAEEADRRAADLIHEMAVRQNAEAALRTSEARLAESQSIARVGSWEWNPLDGSVVWSDMLYRLLGLDPGRVTPNFDLFLNAVHPDDRALVVARMDAAVAGELPYVFDFRIVRPDGTVRILHANAIIDRDETGRPVRWRGTDQDVTERVRSEEERRRLDDRLRVTQRWESLGQLAGGVAHDFNNLMAGVLGNASLARELLPPESPAHEMLAPIEQAAHHAASLCQQLLTFAGKGVSSRGTFDPRSLLAETQDLIRMGVPKTVELHCDAAPDLPALEGDRSQLKQVLLNLVWNAAEAIGAAGGLIEIRMGSSHGGCCPSQAAGHYCAALAHGTYVWLEVRDTGSGIPPEVMARMFDPFFTTKDVGRGLGLSAVAGIVRGHGGVVCVTSQPGAGSCLRVYLAAHDDGSTVRTPPPVVNTPRELPHPDSRLQCAELN